MANFDGSVFFDIIGTSYSSVGYSGDISSNLAGGFVTSSESNVSSSDIINTPANTIHDGTGTRLGFINNYQTFNPRNDDNGHNASVNAPSVAFDFFDRILSNPSNIDLGSFSQATFSSNLYNSYRSNGFEITGVDVSTLGEGASAVPNGFAFPEQHPPQKSLLVDLLFSEVGPPLIDGFVEYLYTGTSNPISNVEGRRVIVLNFIPEDGISETLEWVTQIFKSYNSESRQSIRINPTSKREYKFALDERDKDLFIDAVSNQIAFYTAPSWWDARVVQYLNNSNVIQCDTVDSEFQVGEICLAVSSDGKVFHANTITSITSSSITVDSDITSEIINGYAVPVLSGQIENVSLEKMNNNFYFGKCSIVSVDKSNRVHSGEIFNGEDVLTDQQVIQKRIVASISKERISMDNGIALKRFFPKESREREMEKFEWMTNTIADRKKLKDWIFSRRGKQKQFYKSSRQNDFILYSNYSSTSTQFLIEASEIQAPCFCELKLHTGQVYRFEVLSRSRAENNDILTIASPIGVDITQSEIAWFSLLKIYRQASDSVTLNYSNHVKTKAGVNVINV